METIEIAQAVLKINELLEIVAKGQEIIITKNHDPIVKLSAVKTKKNVLLYSEVIGILSPLVMTLMNP